MIKLVQCLFFSQKITQVSECLKWVNNLNTRDSSTKTSRKFAQYYGVFECVFCSNEMVVLAEL